MGGWGGSGGALRKWVEGAQGHVRQGVGELEGGLVCVCERACVRGVLMRKRERTGPREAA